MSTKGDWSRVKDRKAYGDTLDRIQANKKKGAALDGGSNAAGWPVPEQCCCTCLHMEREQCPDCDVKTFSGWEKQ